MLQISRSGHLCGVITSPADNNLEFVVAGGFPLNQTQTMTEIFSFATNGWRRGPDLPFEVASGAAVQFKVNTM